MKPAAVTMRAARCERCETLAHENVIMRDALEELATRLAKAAGHNPHALRRGMPLWIAFLPERVRALWASRSGGGRGGGKG